MQVSVSIWREVEIYDQVDSLDVDSSAEEISSHKETRAVSLEEIVILDSFLLLKRRVDADWIEKLQFQHFSQLLSPLHTIDKYDDLIERQNIKQLYEFIELLFLLQA